MAPWSVAPELNCLLKSPEEAAQLVRCLSPAEWERLSTMALCLSHAQRWWRVALLADILRPLLMAVVHLRLGWLCLLLCLHVPPCLLLVDRILPHHSLAERL